MTAARTTRILQTIPLLIIIFVLSFPAEAKYSGGTGDKMTKLITPKIATFFFADRYNR